MKTLHICSRPSTYSHRRFDISDVEQFSLPFLALFFCFLAGDEYDFEDEEYYSEEEYPEGDDEAAETNNNNNKVAKTNVLFTADDIIRMFPANENEMAKLEIEGEIRKLKVSSEAAVAAATEEMKLDFKNKINAAVAEIRALRDALGGRPGRKDSFSMPDISPLASARKTPSPVDGKPPIRRKESAQFHSLAGPANAVVAARSMYNMRGPEAAVGARALSPTSRQPTAAFPVLSTPRSSAATPAEPLEAVVAAPVSATAPAPAPAPAPPTPPAGPSEEVVQLQKEMETLKGDMKDIKKLLGNILVKMK